MRVNIQAAKANVARYARVVAHEAAELLRRRKFSYAALALTLAAGSLYLTGVRPAFVTSGGQMPGPSADDHNGDAGNAQPLQTVTGQGTNQSGDNNASTGGTSEQRSHTSVTVNGKDIPVPADGEVHTTLTNDGSTTSVSVSHNASGDNSSSSLNVQVFSQSTASEEGN